LIINDHPRKYANSVATNAKKALYGPVNLIFVIDIVVFGLGKTGKESGTEKGMGAAIEACHPGELRRRHSTPRPPIGPAVGSGPALQPGAAG
jgi:hypothetical protein